MTTGTELLERKPDGKVRCLACGVWIDLRVITSVAHHDECGCFFLMRSSLISLSTCLGGLTFSAEEFVGWWIDKDSGEIVRTP